MSREDERVPEGVDDGAGLRLFDRLVHPPVGLGDDLVVAESGEPHTAFVGVNLPGSRSESLQGIGGVDPPVVAAGGGIEGLHVIAAQNRRTGPFPCSPTAGPAG